VLDSQRRRGVARALLGEVCSLATGLGYPGIRLRVRTGNGPARSLYHRLGFTEHDPLLSELVL
jgi:ribosomal protein S18 acetylase RimI-like enzyme